MVFSMTCEAVSLTAPAWGMLIQKKERFLARHKAHFIFLHTPVHSKPAGDIGLKVNMEILFFILLIGSSPICLAKTSDGRFIQDILNMGGMDLNIFANFDYQEETEVQLTVYLIILET